MITQDKLLLMAFQMILKGRLFGDMIPGEILKLVYYFHKKGWLYIGREEGKIATVVGMYRVKEIKPGMDEKIPEEEEGDKLYVRFAVSFARDKQMVNNIVKKYVNDNNIKEVAFNNLKKGDVLRVIKLGEKDGEKQSIHTRSPEVSAR